MMDTHKKKEVTAADAATPATAVAVVDVK